MSSPEWNQPNQEWKGLCLDLSKKEETMTKNAYTKDKNVQWSLISRDAMVPNQNHSIKIVIHEIYQINEPKYCVIGGPPATSLTRSICYNEQAWAKLSVFKAFSKTQMTILIYLFLIIFKWRRILSLSWNWPTGSGEDDYKIDNLFSLFPLVDGCGSSF